MGYTSESIKGERKRKEQTTIPMKGQAGLPARKTNHQPTIGHNNNGSLEPTISLGMSDIRGSKEKGGGGFGQEDIDKDIQKVCEK